MIACTHRGAPCPTGREVMMEDLSPEKRELLSYRNLRNANRADEGMAGPLEPQCLGRYQIVAELGRGAMGMVYKAHDPRIHRVVAIKIITISGGSISEADTYRTRFFREAQAAGRLSHPGIVGIYDADEDPISRTPYIVMEYVPGKRLDTFVAALPSQRLPFSMSVSLALQIAEALDYAHAQGIVHRDIKPGNVIVTEEGCAKIADFGIAKITLTELTLPGQVLGTPSFMAPEQFLGGSVDGRSDLFSLGVILYWMLTGSKPFPGESATSVCFKLVYQDPIPATQVSPTLPPHFDAVLQRALAKEPAARYQSGKEFAQDLKFLLQEDLAQALESPKKSTDKTSVTGQTGGPSTAMMLRSTAVRAMSVSSQFLHHLQHLLKLKWQENGRRLNIKWGVATATFVVLIAAIGFQRVVGVRTASSQQESLQSLEPAVEPIRATPITIMPTSVPPGLADQRSFHARPAARAAGTPLRKVLLPGAAEPVRAELAPKEPSPPEDAAIQSPNAPEDASLESPKAEAIARATLLTVGEHSFHVATLSISVDGEFVYRGLLTGVRKFPFNKVRGTVSETIRLMPGAHVVKVHVVSERDHCDETKEIEGQFQANELKTLAITFANHNSDIRLAWK